MNLLLSSSRNPSLRVRQFIKALSLIFPKKYVRIVNRGKLGLPELFDKFSSYQIILIISNSHGNPNVITGYVKNRKNVFSWSFEFKIKSVKLEYELNSKNGNNPDKVFINFKEIESDLQEKLSHIFNHITEIEYIPEFNKGPSNSITINIIYLNPGFKFQCTDNKNQIISPEINFTEFSIATTD